MVDFFRFVIRSIPLVIGIICTLTALSFLVVFATRALYGDLEEGDFWRFAVFAAIGLPLTLFGIRQLAKDAPNKPFKKQQPSADEDMILTTCNFELAREELAAFFRMAINEAAAKGQQVVYREEFVRGWERFAQNPCAETARAWLNVAPEYKSMLLGYFVECCPGGRFA